MGTQRVAQTVKNLPAMQEIWVCSLGREDSLEKGMTTHFSIPAWRIPWTEADPCVPADGYRVTEGLDGTRWPGPGGRLEPQELVAYFLWPKSLEPQSQL